MANVTRQCVSCEQEFEEHIDFFRLGANKKFKKKCRSCESARAILWNDTNKDRIKNKVLLNKYGISLETYNVLKETQSNQCAICKQEKGFLCVDHNHTTGKVRGLLCHSCNLAIGNFKEEISSFYMAIQYLERYNNE